MSNNNTAGTPAEDANLEKKEEIVVAQDNASNGNDVSQDIDPKNEVTGVKLLLIHISLCLCTFHYHSPVRLDPRCRLVRRVVHGSAVRKPAARRQNLHPLLGGAIVMLLLALQWGGVTYAWSSSTVIGLFVGAGVILMLFIPWQVYQKDKALIPPRSFSINRNPGLICAASFFINGPFQLIIYWLPIWFQAVLGTSPTQSGVNYFPTVIANVLAAFIGSGIVMQFGWWNPFLLFGEAMVCLGGGLLSTLYPEISNGHWIGYQIFGGIGYSLAIEMLFHV